MRRLLPFGAALVLLSMLAAGCSSPSIGNREDQIVIVTGAGGNSGYGGLRKGLRDAGINTPLSTFHWGAPSLIFVLNLQDRAIHKLAESSLSRKIAAWRTRHPEGRLFLIAHSAGCGVTLGALARLPNGMSVDHVILLAPSVSPGYDLAPALAHVRDRLDVFYSDRDNLWLRWRTSNFGTYDNVRTAAAGHTGFTSVATLPPALRMKVAQHAYDPAWGAFGNDGGHWGTLARNFVARILASACELTLRAAPRVDQ